MLGLPMMMCVTARGSRRSWDWSYFTTRSPATAAGTRATSAIAAEAKRQTALANMSDHPRRAKRSNPCRVSHELVKERQTTDPDQARRVALGSARRHLAAADAVISQHFRLEGDAVARRFARLEQAIDGDRRPNPEIVIPVHVLEVVRV